MNSDRNVQLAFLPSGGAVHWGRKWAMWFGSWPHTTTRAAWDISNLSYFITDEKETVPQWQYIIVNCGISKYTNPYTMYKYIRPIVFDGHTVYANLNNIHSFCLSLLMFVQFYPQYPHIFQLQQQTLYESLTSLYRNSWAKSTT